MENTASNDFVRVKHNAVLHYAVSKSSSNFAREEYRQRFRLKRLGVSPTPPYDGLLVKLSSALFRLIQPIGRLIVEAISSELIFVSVHHPTQLHIRFLIRVRC